MKLIFIVILVIICLVYFLDFSVFFLDKDTEKLFYDGEESEDDDDPVEYAEQEPAQGAVMQESMAQTNDTQINDSEAVSAKSNDLDSGVTNATEEAHKMVQIDDIDFSELDLDALANDLLGTTQKEYEDGQ